MPKAMSKHPPTYSERLTVMVYKYNTLTSLHPSAEKKSCAEERKVSLYSCCLLTERCDITCFSAVEHNDRFLHHDGEHEANKNRKGAVGFSTHESTNVYYMRLTDLGLYGKRSPGK